MVRESVEESPKRSLCKRCQALDLRLLQGAEITALVSSNKMEPTAILTSHKSRDWLKAGSRITLGSGFEWAPHGPYFSPQIYSFGAI